MKNDTHRYVPIGNKWHHILVNVEEWRMRLKGMRWHITSSIAEKSFRKICVKCCTPSPNEMRLRASGFLYRFYQHIWTIFYPSFVSYAHLWWQANVRTEVENQRRGEKAKKNFLSEANYDLTIECATQSNLWDYFVLRCAALRCVACINPIYTPVHLHIHSPAYWFRDKTLLLWFWATKLMNPSEKMWWNGQGREGK